MNKQPELTAATRQKIMDSFWNEYKVKPMKKITISAISKNAGIHRSTFYEYFKDIYDLLEQFENAILTHLENEFIPLIRDNLSETNNSAKTGLEAFVTITLSFFTEYGELLYHLSGPSVDSSFRKKLYCLFKSTFLSLHNVTTEMPYADYLASFVFAIILNNLEYWYEHKDTLSMEEIVSLTYKLIGDSLTNNNFYEHITNILSRHKSLIP